MGEGARDLRQVGAGLSLVAQIGEHDLGDGGARVEQRGEIAEEHALRAACTRLHADPLHREEGVALAAGACGLRELVRGDLAGEQGSDGEHGRAQLVEGGERHLVRSGAQAHAQRRRAGSEVLDAAPGEWQARRVPLLREQIDAGVEGGVEERGVQAEGAGAAGSVGQGDLGEGLVAAPPDTLQALEGGAVVEAQRAEALVHVGGLDLLGVLRRPGAVERVRGGGGRAQQTAGVPRPGIPLRGGRVSGGVLGAGVDLHRAAARVVGLAEGDLDVHAALLAEHERGLERELLDGGAAGLCPGPQGQLGERRAGQQHGAEHGVIGEPGVGVEREAAREKPSAAARELHAGAEQRMAGGELPDRRRFARSPTRRKPEALALEGVEGQLHARGAGAREEAFPVKGRPARPHSREGGEQRGHLRPLAAQQRQGRDAGSLAQAGGSALGPLCGVLGVDAVLDHRAEHAAGSELKEAGHALRGEQAGAVEEAHGLAHVTHPVRGGADGLPRRSLGARRLPRAERLRRDGLPREVGDDGDPRRMELDVRGDPLELLEHGVHARRVEGVGDAQPLGAPPALLPQGGNLKHSPLVTGDNDGDGAVDGGERDLLLQPGERGQHLLGGGLQRDHGAAGGQLAHETPARGDQTAGVLQREHTRDVRGRQLADGVPDEEVGTQAPVGHQPEQRHLQREEAGLRKHRLVEQSLLDGVAILAEHDLAQRAPQQRVEVRAGLVEGPREDGAGAVQLAPHAGALGALAGKEKGEAAAIDRSADGAAGHLPPGERAKLVKKLGAVGSDCNPTVLVQRQARK